MTSFWREVSICFDNVLSSIRQQSITRPWWTYQMAHMGSNVEFIGFYLWDTPMASVLFSLRWRHMDGMAYRIIGISTDHSTACPEQHQRHHKSSPLLALCECIHRWTVVSPHSGAVTRKVIPSHNISMLSVMEDAILFLEDAILCDLSTLNLIYLN